MNEPHIIRLRGPWNRVVVTDRNSSTEKSGATTVRMPSGWSADLGAHFDGVVRYERMFNCPTNIHSETNIRLRLLAVVGESTQVRLNNKVLGTVCWPSRESEFDLTGKLERRNLLEIEVASRASASNEEEPGLVGEVHLEIR